MELLQASNITLDEIKRLTKVMRKQICELCGYSNAGDLRPIVKKMGGRIEYIESWRWYSDDVSIEVYGPQDFLICLPQETTVIRDRFPVAHDLGHYFLHSNQGQRPGKATRSSMSKRIEWEANWFAAEFLMPEDDFRRAYQGCEGDLRAVAKQFAVSVDVARVRKEVLKLG